MVLILVELKLAPPRIPKFPADKLSPKESDIRKNAAAAIIFFIILENCVNLCYEISLGSHTYMSVNELTVLEEQQSRDASDVISHRNVIALVHIV